MHWKKSKGNKYLFRSLDRYGHGKSLGPRSAETEAVFYQFHQKKKQLSDRLKHLTAKLQEQARFCKAARIVRVPAIVTAILRIFEQHHLLGRNLQIVGTNALYAYEARAGVFFDRGLLATQDMDVLWDTRPMSTPPTYTPKPKKAASQPLLTIHPNSDRNVDHHPILKETHNFIPVPSF